MPYKMYKDGSQYCVHKAEGGVKGELVKCHPTRGKAIAHMQALNINVSDENKEKGMEVATMYYENYPTTFSELDERRETDEKLAQAWQLSDDFFMLARNIMGSDQIEDKASAIKALADEYASRVQNVDEQEPNNKSLSVFGQIVQKIKSAVGLAGSQDQKDKLEANGNFLVFKDVDGQWRWLTRYSNKFRDNDNPPEIISEESHRRFVQLVDEKQAALPELWLWHQPEWKFGDATWVAWDDAGFALAAGYVDKGKEDIAEWLSKQGDVAVSHGMPTRTIKRDSQDKSIIIEHETIEISPLPAKYAANKLTGFVLFDETKEITEEDMAIPTKKLEALVKDWGVNPESLRALEEQNAADAQKAIDDGVEFKEAVEEDATTATDAAEEVVTTTESAEEEVVAEPDVREDQAEQPVYPTVQEVAEAIASLVVPRLKEVSDRMDAIENKFKDLQEDERTIVEKTVMETPNASLAAILAQRMSVTKSAEALVDGRSSLAKDKPTEAPDSASGRTPIPFLNRMLDTK